MKVELSRKRKITLVALLLLLAAIVAARFVYSTIIGRWEVAYGDADDGPGAISAGFDPVGTITGMAMAGTVGRNIANAMDGMTANVVSPSAPQSQAPLPARAGRIGPRDITCALCLLRNAPENTRTEPRAFAQSSVLLYRGR